MSIVHDPDLDPRDDELHARLDALARAGTAGLELDHPQVLGVASIPLVGSHRRRVGRWMAAVAAAAVVALVGVAVWAPSGDTDSSSVASGGTSASVTPAEQLRAAVAATRASRPFQIRSTSVDPGGAPMGSIEPEERGALPYTVGTGSEQSASVWTYDGEGRVGMSWASAAGRTPVRLIHDTVAGDVYWQQEDGGWRRAPWPDDGPMQVTDDPMTMWGSASCVASEGEDTLVVSLTSGGCPADLSSAENRLVIHLAADGRIASVERPARIGTDGIPMAETAWTSSFDYVGVAPLQLPDPASVTDSPTPMGFAWVFSGGLEGGWASPMEPAPLQPPGAGG